MKIPGRSKLKRGAQWLESRFAPGGLILLYHRVAEIAPDPFKLCVTPQHFAEHLQVLKRCAYPVTLQQLTQAVQEGKSVDRWVAITFDDGYADNLHHAKPLLEQYQIPATIFVATGHLNHEREFWWDELERVFLQPGTLPATLKLNIDDQVYEWDLAATSSYCEADYKRDRDWSWYVAEGADPTPRHQIYRSLYQQIRLRSVAERQRILNQLLDWAGIDSAGRSTHRTLSIPEVCALEGSVVEVGAHTVNHPFLSNLSEVNQRDELQYSKAALEAILKRSVNSFAYPHGDYTPETVAIADAVGFTAACSTRCDRVRSKVDKFQLPRIEVQNWDRQAFTKQLSKWFYLGA